MPLNVPSATPHLHCQTIEARLVLFQGLGFRCNSQSPQPTIEARLVLFYVPGVSLSPYCQTIDQNLVSFNVPNASLRLDCPMIDYTLLPFLSRYQVRLSASTTQRSIKVLCLSMYLVRLSDLTVQRSINVLCLSFQGAQCASQPLLSNDRSKYCVS